MSRFFRYLSNANQGRPWVRPWALCAPAAVLLISLPLLRPLRAPEPGMIGDDELSRLAAVQSIVEQKSLAIDKSPFSVTSQKIARNGHLYSDQPPMLAALLSGPYWAMRHSGTSLSSNPLWAMYLLTIMGVTLPVALSAGLIYRMGRIFELKRPWRTALALVVVLGSGLISYCTVLNSHAPAAALLLAASACVFHVTLAPRPARAAAWLGLSGFCAAMAATIDMPAAVFLPLMLPVAAAFRWPLARRLAGMAAYVIGAAVPLVVHVALQRQMTGDLVPGFLHPELIAAVDHHGPADLLDDGTAESPLITLRRHDRSIISDDDDDSPPSTIRTIYHGVASIVCAFFGGHGILSHFPVIVFGVIGIGMIMHRHWPHPTKVLAAVTLAGAIFVILIVSFNQGDWKNAMFASRWFVAFLPITLFWAGAWLRKPHGRAGWSIAGILLGFSTAVALLGATGPVPRGGFDRYTAAGAVMNLIDPPAPPPLSPSAKAPVLAQK